jgi:hypothetical protein
VLSASGDSELIRVAAFMRGRDPDGIRTAAIVRQTYDQIYDGQRTGRYRFEQLRKTEKTHFGSILEINLQRDLDLPDGTKLDFRIADVEVDCKWSMKMGGWMFPLEAENEICMLLWADDATSRWSLGLWRVSADGLGSGNRDRKRQMLKETEESVTWLFRDARMPENILLSLGEEVVAGIRSHRAGAAKVAALFREALGRLVGREAVLTVAMQKDALKRVRANGGARDILRPEGIVILAGTSVLHRTTAAALGLPVPNSDQFVAARLTEVSLPGTRPTARVGGLLLAVAREGEPSAPPAAIGQL